MITAGACRECRTDVYNRYDKIIATIKAEIPDAHSIPALVPYSEPERMAA